MRKTQVTLNGFMLWSRITNRVVFARQLEPTNGLVEEGQYNPLSTPILVGFDGEEGRELGEVLEENASLRKLVYTMKDENYINLRNYVDSLYFRVELIEQKLKNRWFRIPFINSK